VAAEGAQAEGSAASEEAEEAFDEDLLPASCLFYGVRGARDDQRVMCAAVQSKSHACSGA
jgi:hypothetical protein